jgi:hypothetical protein
MKEIIEELRGVLPPIFAGQNLDDLTGGAIVWRTVLNARAAKQVPGSCFVRSGRKVLVRRDQFLDWWQGTLREEVSE